MDTAQVIVGVLGALGAGGLIAQLVRFAMKRADGSAAREASRNTSLESQRSKAVHDRDQADAKARIMSDYAARERRKVIELGGTPEEWPDLEHTLTPAQIRNLRRQPKEKP